MPFRPNTAAALALLLAACAASPASPDPARGRPAATLGPLEPLLTQHRAVGTTSPDEAVGGALVAAHDACDSLRIDDQWDLETWGANADTDAWLEAWLRVDEAINLGDVAAAPLPEPVAVGVEQQMIARDERDIPPGYLHLYTLNTREHFQIRVYDNAGRMRLDAVREASWALRDQRAGIARSISPRLLAMLYFVGQSYDAELEVVSGYRLRDVNASRGSRHGSADACDFRIEGVGVRELARFLEGTFADAGIGYYPTSGFVHLDDRDVTFYWVDYSGPGQRSRTRARSIDVRTDPADDPTTVTPNITEERLYILPPERAGYGY